MRNRATFYNPILDCVAQLVSASSPNSSLSRPGTAVQVGFGGADQRRNVTRFFNDLPVNEKLRQSSAARHGRKSVIGRGFHRVRGVVGRSERKVPWLGSVGHSQTHQGASDD